VLPNRSHSLGKIEFRDLMKLLVFIAIVVLALPHSAYPWGAGHDDVMRAVIARLPEELRDSFTPEIIKQAVAHASHYPDSFEPFLAEDIGEAAVFKLNEAGFKKRFDLHSEQGAAMTFLMLVDALREKHPARTAHWIATLSHVISDMVACNHDPLVQTAGTRWSDWNLTTPNANDFSKIKRFFDLSGTARDQAGGAEIFEKAIDAMRLYDDQRDATATLVELMSYGEQGADYCSGRGAAILEGAVGWIDHQSKGARQKMWQNMSELGAWGVVRTLRDVEVAMRLARTGEALTITPEVIAAAQQEAEQIRQGRSLEKEALFASVLRNWKRHQPPAVGVVLEPAWRMNGSMLGYAGRVEAAAIARTLQHRGKSYVTLDVRQVLQEGFPTPEQVPQIVLVAPSFHSYHEMKAKSFDDRITDYLKQGGRVLWVMGTSLPASRSFASFNAALSQPNSPAAKSKLPVTDEEFLGAVLNLIGTELPPQTIAHRANFQASWVQPLCPWSFDLTKNSDLKPLVTLTSGTRSQVVGAVSSNGKTACIPIYALTSYLLAGEQTVTSPHEPVLDAAAESILFAMIRCSPDESAKASNR